MTEKGTVEPDGSLSKDKSRDRAAQADTPNGALGPNQRPKDPWRAFFELLDEPADLDEPKV